MNSSSLFILWIFTLIISNPTFPPSSLVLSSAPAISYVLSPPSTFATQNQLEGFGFKFGPSDGTFGAIPLNGMNYTFYAPAGAGPSCPGTPNLNGAFTFTGTLDHITESNCARLFGPGDGPTGWLFDANYAGGGQVVRFAVSGQSG